MGATDLDAVGNRRAVLARELIGLQNLRAKLEAEQQELAMAERVLRRLAHLPVSVVPLAPPSEYDEHGIRRLSVERVVRPDEHVSPRPEYFTRLESGGGEIYSSISEFSSKLAQVVLRQPARLSLLLKRKP